MVSGKVVLEHAFLKTFMKTSRPNGRQKCFARRCCKTKVPTRTHLKQQEQTSGTLRPNASQLGETYVFLKLYKKFCPGPITFILDLKKNSKISKLVTNKKKTLAVRFPKHPITRNLLKILKFPLEAPSANL